MARQPEPDLEFTEEELDQTTATRPASLKSGKKSRGGRPLLWIFLLLLVGGIAYLAMEPEQLADWLAPFSGDNPPEPHATATRPKTAPPTAPPPASTSTAPATPPTASETAPSGTPTGPMPPSSTRIVPTRLPLCCSDGSDLTRIRCCFSDVCRRAEGNRDRESDRSRRNNPALFGPYRCEAGSCGPSRRHTERARRRSPTERLGLLGSDGRRRQGLDPGKAAATEVLNPAIALVRLLFVTPVL